MLEQILQDLNEKGWSYQQHILKENVLLNIGRYFDEHRTTFHPAKVGIGDNKVRMEEIRGDFTLWLDPINPPAEFQNVMDLLERLKTEVNQRFYLGLKQFECHLAYYPPGTFYKKHRDRFENNSSRSLSFIFYLSQDWKKENGGELILYNSDGKIVETIYPLPGSFVCFLSEDFPHEVKSANIERRSLTGWMHTKMIY